MVNETIQVLGPDGQPQNNNFFVYLTTISNNFLTKVQSLTADDWNEQHFMSSEELLTLQGFNIDTSLKPADAGIQEAPNTKQILIDTTWSVNKEANGKYYLVQFETPEIRAEINNEADRSKQKILLNRYKLMGKITKKYFNPPAKFQYFKPELDDLKQLLSGNFNFTGRFRFISLYKTTSTNYCMNPMEGFSSNPLSTDYLENVAIMNRRFNEEIAKLNPNEPIMGRKPRAPLRRLLIPLVVPNNVIFRSSEGPDGEAYQMIMKPNEIWTYSPFEKVYVSNPDGVEVIFMRLIWQTTEFPQPTE